MKTYYFRSLRFICLICTAVLAIFIIRPVNAQEQTPKESQKNIKIKVVKKVNGKTIVLDTTITRNEATEKETIDDLVDKAGGDMEEIEMELNDADGEIYGADSIDLDSELNKIQKIIRINRDGKSRAFGFGCCPEGYNYSFDFDRDFPGLPDCSKIWEDLENDHVFEMQVPRSHRGYFREEDQGTGSLNELLGKIPMERVKSYSIKERKNGKRIIIDVEDGPMFEENVKTIIMSPAGKPMGGYNRHRGPEHDVKVIIRTDKDEKKGEAPSAEPKKEETPKSESGKKSKI